MGGYGSGRSGGQPTVNDGLVLDLNKLIRNRFFRPGQTSTGPIVWSNLDSGEPVASITFKAVMADERGHVFLRYSSTNRWTGEKRDNDYPIEMETTPQPFGGRRWWFRCPIRGDLVAKLYLPPGAHRFASRKAYRLAYACQRETEADRAMRKARKLHRRLGGDANLIDGVPPKPKWMRWHTYGHLVEQIDAAEEVIDEQLVRLAGRLMSRSRRKRKR